MRGTRVKKLRTAMMESQFEKSDLATRADRKMIKADKDQRTLFRARKKNYNRKTQSPKLKSSKRQIRLSIKPNL
jgi:hypothetical protein